MRAWSYRTPKHEARTKKGINTFVFTESERLSRAIKVRERIFHIGLTPRHTVLPGITNSQTSREQTKARGPKKKMAESEENISTMKLNQNIYNDLPAIMSRVVSRKSTVHASCE